METIGFIGLGRMGRHMAANLVAAGFVVRVWNRTPVNGMLLGLSKAAASAKLDKAGLKVRWIVPGVYSDTIERDLVAEEHPQPGHDLRKGGTVSVALSRKLREAHRGAGHGFVAAPVFGRPEAAEKKQLWIVCGGAQNDLGACERLFASIGRGTFTLNDAPQANLVKLIGNFLIASTMEAIGEASALAEKGGIDPRRLMEFFGSTIASPGPMTELVSLKNTTGVVGRAIPDSTA